MRNDIVIGLCIILIGCSVVIRLDEYSGVDSTDAYVEYQSAMAEVGLFTTLSNEDGEFNYLLNYTCADIYESMHFPYNTPLDWAFEEKECYKKTNYSCYLCDKFFECEYREFTFYDLDSNVSLRKSCRSIKMRGMFDE